MAWQSSGSSISNLNWEYNAPEGGMTRRNQNPTTNASLWYVSSSKSFSPNKNYQFITTVEDFKRFVSPPSYEKFLEIETPWGSTFSYSYNANSVSDTRPSSGSVYDLVYFSNPQADTISSDMIEYKSTYDGFGNPSSDGDGTPVIKEFKLVEFDWIVQGWALYQNTNTDTEVSSNMGWSYFEAIDTFTFRPWDSSTTTSIRYPLGYFGASNVVSHGFTYSNYITRYIPYPIFNISFNVNTGASTQSYIDVYLITTLNNNIRTNIGAAFDNQLSGGQFLGRIQDDGPYTFYNLTGEQYIFFNASPADTGQRIDISNFQIDGSYQLNDNNKQFLFTNSGTYSEPTDLCLIGGSYDATYSVVIVNENTLHNPTASSFFGPTGFPGFFSNLYGNVINLNSLNAKVGNGIFKAGIWENGVWNSGWRVDSNVYEFDDVELSLLMETTNTRWRIQLKGPQTSTQNFSVGDKVSIGNIVGIDINENRKLMKNYFTILSVNNNNIVVDFNNTFPLRRIEKDSENHKIKVSKNIWLNGGFLNGYFEGIWNSGLFKGFPYITEMFNTHWIDGKYDGGHFYGEYPEYTFVDTYYWGPTSPNTLGLTFGATAHGFEIGDLIEIDKDDKTINIQYDGFATVIDVIDDYLIVIDKGFGSATPPGSEGGTIKRRTGTAVIQNFEFYDNNIAKLTIQNTINLKQVYNYNSWVDVKYLDESASNLGRNQFVYAQDVGEFAINNLYGHITEDVLSSLSSFRNSYNLAKTIYSLGTKYKIYEDFLGEISEFNEPFGTSQSRGGLDNFYNNGWTYSLIFMSQSQFELDRTDIDDSLEIIVTGPNLGLFNLGNTNIDIEKRRYSMIEFDLLSYVASTDDFFGSLPGIWLLGNVFIPNSNNPAYPDQEYVHHIRTKDTKKYEYFYNKKELDILLPNTDGFTASLDNIKMYELDMVPFFKYMTEEYINKAVQVPYQGIAPFIDYTDSEFSFIDNIDIGLDSLSTQQSYNPPSGGGGLSDDGIYNQSQAK